LQFEIEMNEGDDVGIFTIIVSLSRGEDEINGGGYRLRHASFDKYKESSIARPMYVLKDKSERRAEMLFEQGRGKEAEKIFESSASTSQGPEDEMTPEERHEEGNLNRSAALQQSRNSRPPRRPVYPRRQQRW